MKGRPHLDQLLASSVTRVQLEGLVPAQLGDEMRGRRFSDTRRSGDEDGFVRSESVLARLLKTSLAVAVPDREEGRKVSSRSSEHIRGANHVPLLQPLGKLLNRRLVAADLRHGRRGVFGRPELGTRRRRRFPEKKKIESKVSNRIELERRERSCT